MLVPVEGTSFFAYLAPNSALAPGSLAILAAIRRASSLVSMSPLLAQSGHGADIGAMKQIADQAAARDHSGVDIIAKRAVEYVWAVR